MRSRFNLFRLSIDGTVLARWPLGYCWPCEPCELAACASAAATSDSCEEDWPEEPDEPDEPVVPWGAAAPLTIAWRPWRTPPLFVPSSRLEFDELPEP